MARAVAHGSIASSGSVYTINRLLTAMSQFGDNLPASTVVYALAMIGGFLYIAAK